LYVKVHYFSVVRYNKIIVIASIIVVLIMPWALSHPHHAIDVHHVMCPNFLQTKHLSVKPAKKANCLDCWTCCVSKFL